MQPRPRIKACLVRAETFPSEPSRPWRPLRSMSDTPELSRLITAVFSAWQQAGIDFLVLRNYENLPHFTTNDIDILVAPSQLHRAEQVLGITANAADYRLHNRAEFATLALYFSKKNSTAQAHFDLFTALKWRGFDFLSGEEFLGRKVSKGLFAIPHPAHEAAANLLASFIFSGQVKEKYRPGIAAAFRSDPDAARALLSKTYGEARAKLLVDLAARENWPAIEALVGGLRRSLIARQFLRRPWKTTASLAADTLRLLRRFLRPPGLTVVLCGPDGCGKSTVVPKIVDGLRGTFSPQKGRHIHWKPRVFSSARQPTIGNSGAGVPPVSFWLRQHLALSETHGRDARATTQCGKPGPTGENFEDTSAKASPSSGEAVTNPHGKPPRNAIVSLACFEVHWLEFFLGWLLRVRPVVFKGGLVLIDRFYYDFFVDQRRYRLRVPRIIVRCGYALLPKPDLVFLLDASPEILQLRKQEVAPAETARQRAAYGELVKNFKNGVIVDASQPPEKVAADIELAVLDFLATRTSRRNS